jgi:DNA topoisomerase-1
VLAEAQHAHSSRRETTIEHPKKASDTELKSEPAASLTALDPVAAVPKLRHISDDMPSIMRHKARSGFDYRYHDGELVGDIETLKRISLARNPARLDCSVDLPLPERTHPGDWTRRIKIRQDADLRQVLPVIRERVDADLRRRGLSRKRVLAAVVRLMEVTPFRIGNSEYARPIRVTA